MPLMEMWEVKRENILMKLIVIVVISFILLACNKETKVQTTDKINPLDQSNITEMIIESSGENITITDQKVIEKVIDNLKRIKIKKLSPDQEKSLLNSGKRMVSSSTLSLTLQDELQQAKSLVVILSIKELILVDVKSMRGNSRSISYANLGDEESLNSIEEICNLLWKETYKRFQIKAKGKGINDSMLNILANLGYGEEEILNFSSHELAQIFAPGTPLDGGQFEPNDNQKAELEKLSIDTSMSMILYNLGYEYGEMLKLSPEEINFIFPNTELISNLVARGYKEEDLQIWAVFETGRTYKEIIKEAIQKP